jgi:excisionase family DNA binding protein
MADDLYATFTQFLEQLVDERVKVALEAQAKTGKRWLTPREAGEFLACSERAVYERVRKGRIPAEAVKHSGRRIYIDRDVLDRAIERST